MVQAVNFRIVWCRRQRARACSQLEREAWRAEEDGLRDAVMRRDHMHKYRAIHRKCWSAIYWASRMPRPSYKLRKQLDLVTLYARECPVRWIPSKHEQSNFPSI